MDKTVRKHKPHLGKELELVDVYDEEPEISNAAVLFLYELMKERDPSVNISHRKMPTFEEHSAFVKGCPYRAWFILVYNDYAAGAVYLSHKGELGIFIKTEYQGFGIGKSAIRRMMQKFPRDRFLANINPNNRRSILMFENMGFKHLQNTYELRKDA
jgi:RimJ/RimL family protein N-acetyltransferase